MHSGHTMRPTATDGVARFVRLCVCLLVTFVITAKMTQIIRGQDSP